MIAPRWAGLGYGLITGFVSSCLLMNWLPAAPESSQGVSSVLAWLFFVALMAFRSFMFGLFAVVYRWMNRHGDAPHPFAVAALFMALEFFFPFILPVALGATQYPLLPAIQIAPLTGVYRITFVIVAFNFAAFRMVAARRAGTPLPWSMALPSLAVVAALFSYGFIELHSYEDALTGARTKKVGIVQPAGAAKEAGEYLPSDTKARTDVSELQALSAELEQDHAVDLIIWPEIAVPAGDEALLMQQAQAPLPSKPRAAIDPDLPASSSNAVQRGFSTPLIYINRPEGGPNHALALSSRGRTSAVLVGQTPFHRLRIHGWVSSMASRRTGLGKCLPTSLIWQQRSLASFEAPAWQEFAWLERTGAS